MSNSNRKDAIGIFVLILVFFIIFMVFATYTVNRMQGQLQGRGITPAFESKSAPIGIVEVDGPIMDSKKIIKKLHVAEKNSEIKAIIVRVNSPGGAVGPTQEIYDEMRRIDSEKPIYASFGSMAASGGYYLGAGARKIYANAGTLTGSIGVIMHFMNMSKLYEFLKVSPFVVKSGKYKDVGSPLRQITPEEMNLMSDMINGVHSQFKRDILATRKEKIQGNLDDHAQGQIFSGEQAKELGLIDEVAGMWKAAREIHQELAIEKDFGVQYIKLQPDKFSFKEIFSDIEESFQGAVLGGLNMVPMLIYYP